jgi:hypothetical protein
MMGFGPITPTRSATNPNHSPTSSTELAKSGLAAFGFQVRENLPFISVTVVMDKGAFLEVAPPRGFFKQPRHQDAKLFISRILSD